MFSFLIFDDCFAVCRSLLPFFVCWFHFFRLFVGFRCLKQRAAVFAVCLFVCPLNFVQ